MSTESLDSIIDEAPEENGLRAEARDLIEFVSKWYVVLTASVTSVMLACVDGSHCCIHKFSIFNCFSNQCDACMC